MTTTTTSTIRPGPIRLPQPTRPEDLRITQRLAGHSTSESWLASGEWPELDACRDTQLRHRDQLVAALEGLHDLEDDHAREDREHAEALRSAYRDGTPDAVQDKRTSIADREQDRAALLERVWAAAHAFSEAVTDTIATVREHEDRWLADLRSRRDVAEVKRREAARMLDEARAIEHRISRLGQWVQLTADDEGIGQQPAPTVEPVPVNFNPSALSGALERPWHRARPWTGVEVTA